MEIKWQWKGRVFSFCIGYKTKWFEQVYLACLMEEYHKGDSMSPESGKMLWNSV